MRKIDSISLTSQRRGDVAVTNRLDLRPLWHKSPCAAMLGLSDSLAKCLNTSYENKSKPKHSETPDKQFFVSDACSKRTGPWCYFYHCA